MKLTLPWRVLLVAGLAFAAGRLLPIEAPNAAAHAAEIESADAVRLATRPGPAHAHLNALVGRWTVTATAYPRDGEPVVARGTVQREWVLDGRFVREKVDAKGSFGAFRGLGFVGHNNVEGQYELVWMENQSTAMVFERGTYDMERKVLATRGGHRDPATGRLVPTRSEARLADPDRHVIIGWEVDANGREVKSFEGVFERRR